MFYFVVFYLDFLFFFPNCFLCLHLLEFPPFIFKMIMCLFCKKFLELGNQFVCIFFYPLNHMVMGDIKVSNICISVHHMKPPWNYLCVCLALKYSYIFVTDYAVSKEWGFCSFTPLLPED